MIEPVTPVLAPWSSFYTMIGSSAAALTGLMFIVITLVSGSERMRRSDEGISAYSTPTVVHFGAALLVSAMLSAPWSSLIYPAILLGIAGLCGVAYIVRVMIRARSIAAQYEPDLEDWACYTILPLAGYGTIFIGAIALAMRPHGAMFAVAAGITLLIFIGIHNAWDIVTYLAIQHDDPPESK